MPLQRLGEGNQCRGSGKAELLRKSLYWSMRTGIKLPFALRATPTVRGAFLLGLKKGVFALTYQVQVTL